MSVGEAWGCVEQHPYVGMVDEKPNSAAGEPGFTRIEGAQFSASVLHEVRVRTGDQKAANANVEDSKSGGPTIQKFSRAK